MQGEAPAAGNVYVYILVRAEKTDNRSHFQQENVRDVPIANLKFILDACSLNNQGFNRKVIN